MTWNSGTEISVAWSGSRCSVAAADDALDVGRKFSWVIIAPLGRPVVPARVEQRGDVACAAAVGQLAGLAVGQRRVRAGRRRRRRSRRGCTRPPARPAGCSSGRRRRRRAARPRTRAPSRAPLPSRTATRSPGPTPASRRPPATRRRAVPQLGVRRRRAAELDDRRPLRVPLDGGAQHARRRLPAASVYRRMPSAPTSMPLVSNGLCRPRPRVPPLPAPAWRPPTAFCAAARADRGRVASRRARAAPHRTTRPASPAAAGAGRDRAARVSDATGAGPGTSSRSTSGTPSTSPTGSPPTGATAGRSSRAATG